MQTTIRKALIEPPTGEIKHMPHRIFPLIDWLMFGLATIVSSIASFVIIAEERITGDISELRLLMIPMAGAAVMTALLVMFKIRKEPVNVIMARGGFALFFGGVTNIVISIFIPVGAKILLHPVILLVGGAVSAIFFYIVSLAFVKKVYQKSDYYADALVEKIEEKAKLPKE